MENYKSRPLITFVFFVGLFSAIYGPKVFGVLDLMVLVPFFLIVILISASHNFIKAEKYLFFLIGISSFIFFQLLAFNLFENINDPYFLLRTTRSFFSEILIFILFYSITKRGWISHKTVVDLITIVFLIGAFVVYIQAFFPQTQSIFAGLWGFDKRFLYFRAFGMSAGYDTTGYLLSWAAAFLMLYWFRFRYTSSFLAFLFVAGAVMFTSRTSMVLLIALCGLSVLLSKSYYKFFSFANIILISTGVFFVYFFIYPVIAASIFNNDGGAIIFGGVVNERFATTDILKTVTHHYVVPDTLYGNLFGLGYSPKVDPGYFITIFKGGGLLLGTFLFFYVFSLFYVYKSYKNIKHYAVSVSQRQWIEIWMAAIFLMLVVIVIGNFKNFYFFTRGFHEFFVFLIAVALGFSHKAKISIKDGAYL